MQNLLDRAPSCAQFSGTRIANDRPFNFFYFYGRRYVIASTGAGLAATPTRPTQRRLHDNPTQIT